MNKLNLLLFASILSIQTPVINQAYAQDPDQSAIEEEESVQETQAELSADDFQNMNEANFDQVDDNIKKHISKKISELGKRYKVAFFKNDKHVIASIYRPKDIRVDTSNTIGKAPQNIVVTSDAGGHEVSFFYRNGTTKEQVVKIRNNVKENKKNYNKLLRNVLGNNKVDKKHISKHQIDNYLAHKEQRREAAEREAEELARKRGEAGEEFARTGKQKVAEREAEELARKRGEAGEEFARIGKQKVAEREAAISTAETEREKLIAAQKAVADREADPSGADDAINYLWNDSTRTTQLTKRTEEATQQQEIFDKANQKVKELGGTPLTQPGKIVDNQTLWNKVTSWTSKLTGQPNQNPQQPTGGTGNPANTIPTQPQQAAGSTAAPTTQQQQPTGGTGFTLSQPSTWFGGWSIFGSGQNNQPSATPTQGTLSPSSSPTQHTSSPIAQSSPASGSAVSKSTKKVTPPKASGLIDRWFDSKPKTRSERTRSVQEKHKSQEHQKNRFTASKTHKNNNITQEWDETKKKGKEEISAVISDANSALSK